MDYNQRFFPKNFMQESYFDFIPNEITALIISYINDFYNLKSFNDALEFDDNIYQIATLLLFPKSYNIWKEILDRFPQFEWKYIIFLKLSISEIKDFDSFIYETNQDHLENPSETIIIEIMPDPENESIYKEYHNQLRLLEKVLYLKIAFPVNVYQKKIAYINIDKIYNEAYEEYIRSVYDSYSYEF